MAPKLNSHCWYDIKLAAAKKPDLRRPRRGPFEGQPEVASKAQERTEQNGEMEKMIDCAYVAEEKTCFSGGS